jgi:putative FmdB family regulatory protein
MPLYEYECTACRRHTEKIQKFSDPEITVCPHCGGSLERVVSAPAIAFKGGGWYADGYGNAKPKSKSSSDSSTGSAANGDSKSSGSDSKSSGSETKSSTDSSVSSSTPAGAPAAAPAPASSSSDKK